MIRILLKIIKYTLISIVVILGLMFSAPYLFADKIEESIKKTANKQINGELNYSNSELSFFQHFPSLTLTLSDFTLKGSVPFEKEPLINAKEVSFGIGILSLIFDGEIDIDQLFLSDLDINIKVNEKGFANYNVSKSDPSAQKKDSADTKLRLKNIEILNSKLTYDDLSTNVHVDIEGLNYTGKADLKKSIFDLHSKAIINKINVIYDKEPYLMNKKIDADLITKINLNSLSFLFEQNNLKINQFVVDLKGSFDFLKEGYKMDLMVKSKENSIEDILSGFPPKFITWLDKTNVKGYADLSFELKGDYIASKNIAPDLNFDLKIKNGFINYDNSPFPVSNLNTDLSIKLPSLEPEQLNVDVKNLALNINQDFLKAKFKSQGLSSPFVDADINADIDIGKLVQAVGYSYIGVKGKLTGNVKAKGKVDLKKEQIPVMDARVVFKEGYLKTPYYPNPISNIAIDSKISSKAGTFRDLSVLLNPATLTFEGNPFRVKANLYNFNDLAYDVKARGTLNLSKIYKVFAIEGIGVEGELKANVELKGKQSDVEKGKYLSLKNKGTLEVKNIQIATDYLPQKLYIKKGIFDIAGDRVKFKTFLLNYGDSDFKMNGYLKNVVNFLITENGILYGAFNLNSDYINVNEFMSTVDAKTPEDKDVVKATKTNVSKENTGVVMIPRNFDLSMMMDADKINFQDLLLLNSKGSVRMKKGKVTMENTSFDLIGCNVNMSGTYEGIKPKKANFEYQIQANDFNVKKAYQEVKIFREMASAAEKAEGIISLDYKLKGRLNRKMEPVYPSLVGAGTISVKEVKLFGMKMFNAVSKATNQEKLNNPEISKVDIKSSIKNNIITLERFKFKFAGFRPRIEGTTSLDGKLNLKMRLGLPPLGIIGIPLTITGNKDKPKIKLRRSGKDLAEEKDDEDADE